jgi:hypothetical protein
MYWPIIASLLCTNLPVIPPAPADGSGLWLTSNCEWVSVPCPSYEDFKNPDRTLRLPAFCPLALPRIGYSVKTDAAVRGDLRKASSLIPALTAALSSCRLNQDESTADCLGLAEQSKAWLNDCVKESTLQLGEVEKLERSHSIYQTWAISSTVVVTVLTAILIMQGQM